MQITNSPQRMNMKEMEAVYPDRWAVIVNIEGGHVYDYQTTTGVVYAISDTESHDHDLHILAGALDDHPETYGEVSTPIYIFGPIARQRGTMGALSL